MREALIVVLAGAVVFQPVIAPRAESTHAAPSPEGAKSGGATLKEQALRIPPQSFVEVRLQNKEKVRGRLAGITDEGLTLQVARGDKIETRELAFNDVNSIKVKKGSTAKTVALWTLAGVGVFFLAVLTVCSTAGCS